SSEAGAARPARHRSAAGREYASASLAPGRLAVKRAWNLCSVSSTARQWQPAGANRGGDNFCTGIPVAIAASQALSPGHCVNLLDAVYLSADANPTVRLPSN